MLIRNVFDAIHTFADGMVVPSPGLRAQHEVLSSVVELLGVVRIQTNEDYVRFLWFLPLIWNCHFSKELSKVGRWVDVVLSCHEILNPDFVSAEGSCTFIMPIRSCPRDKSFERASGSNWRRGRIVENCPRSLNNLS